MCAEFVIEIALQPDGRVPAELVKEAYRASVRRRVAFVLQDVAPSAVDEVLDDIVPLLPLAIPGVLYIDINDEKKVEGVLFGADRVFAGTERFRALLEKLGIQRSAVHPVASALEALRVEWGRIERHHTVATKSGCTNEQREGLRADETRWK